MSTKSPKDVVEIASQVSGWPDKPGFYWWRGAPSFRWEMMQVMAHGAEEDSSRYTVHKVEACNISRSLQIWKERGPACGEWVEIRQPETPEEMQARQMCEHICALNRAIDGTCFVCGSLSLENVKALMRARKEGE